MEHTFKIIGEEERDGCWMFQITVLDGNGTKMDQDHTLRLAWEDYDLWVRDGTVEPSVVAQAIVRHLESAPNPRPLPERIDSSYPRRLDPEADRQIMALIDPVSFRSP